MLASEEAEMGLMGREMAEVRAATDHSLGAGPLEDSSPPGDLRDRQILDDLIERDRLAADNRWWKFRASEDSLLAYERSLSQIGVSFTERAEADEHTKSERNDMDARVGRERARADEDLKTERRSQDSARAGTVARRLATITSVTPDVELAAIFFERLRDIASRFERKRGER